MAAASSIGNAVYMLVGVGLPGSLHVACNGDVITSVRL